MITLDYDCNCYLESSKSFICDIHFFSYIFPNPKKALKIINNQIIPFIKKKEKPPINKYFLILIFTDLLAIKIEHVMLYLDLIKNFKLSWKFL